MSKPPVTMPIYYVVSYREVMQPWSQWVLRHIIAVIPGDMNKVEDYYKEIVAPLQQLYYSGVQVDIYSRNPMEWDKALANELIVQSRALSATLRRLQEAQELADKQAETHRLEYEQEQREYKEKNET
jgi:hypothetical protein